MELIITNEVDLALVPEQVQTDICRSAIRGLMERRKDPEYQERYRRWKEARKARDIAS